MEGNLVNYDIAGPCSGFIISGISGIGHPAGNAGAAGGMSMNSQAGTVNNFGK